MPRWRSHTYFDPEGGFHLQGLLALGILAVNDTSEADADLSATGPLGLGYIKFNHTVMSPALLATITDH